jgi:four helix bundle protein
MSTARRFEDLAAWQFCREMEDVIFEITEAGPVKNDEEFRSQIRDAAKKAPPLVAEGFIRFVPKEFVRYLRMARGEIAEVQSRLHSGKSRKYFTTDQLARARPITNRAMGTTTNLLKAKLRQPGESL